MVFHAYDDKLREFSKSKFRVSIPIIINLILSIILMILSIQQSFPVNEVGEEMILNAYFTAWYRNVCLNRMIKFVSPFLFNMKLEVYQKEYGLMGCPWRFRNTIYRLVVICLIIIVSLWMLAILYINHRNSKNSKNNKKKTDALKGIQFWIILYWFKYILLVAMVILFILDCDSMYSGYWSCLANFDITGLGPLVLQLLGAYFTTTTAPAWPEGNEPVDTYNNGQDITIITEFNVTDTCYLTPFIWTCLTDFAIIITSYAIHKISRFVKFDDDNDNDNYNNNETKHHNGNAYDDDDDDDEEGDERQKRRTTRTTTRNNNNRVRGTNPFGSPAYSIQNSAYMPKKKQSESLFEPHEWNQRKPTYEQNYS